MEIIYLLVALGLILVIFIIYGLLATNNLGAVYIDSSSGGVSKKICQNEQVSCLTDLDCQQVCRDNVQMTCQEVKRNNSNDENLFGSSGYYCLPKKPDKPCNEKNGGIWVWSGYSSTERMEWDCLCTYPGFYGNEGCTKLNPGVCDNGTFSYDATQGKAPLAANCSCNDGFTLLAADESDVPICVPKNIYSGYYTGYTPH